MQDYVLRVLHLGIYRQSPLLWFENQSNPSKSPAVRRRSKKALQKPTHLPFDMNSREMEEVLNDLGITTGEKDRKVCSTPVLVWLPTIAGCPIPSNPIIGKCPPLEEEAQIVPWQINAICLDDAQLTSLLSECAEKESLAPGLLLGADVRYWCAVLRFAGSLVLRQRFLPSLRSEEGVCRAVWNPVLIAEDLERVRRFADAMPDVCRAFTDSPEHAPSMAPEYVLRLFLSRMIDDLVRSGKSSAPVPIQGQPKRRKKSAKATPFDSLHDQWIHALHTEDGRMEGTPAELQELHQQLEAWRRPLLEEAEAPFRLCFRLEEPQDGTQGQEAWNVRYLMQARDDLSLLISATDAWNARGALARQFKKRKVNPLEFTLRSLGRASQVCPQIERSLKTPKPAGYELTTPGAFEFLSQYAPALEQGGYGLLLPAWWSQGSTRQRVGLRGKVKSSKMSSASGLSLDQIVQFNWTAALGDESLTLDELKSLAKLKSPLVKFRGQWVHVGAEEIQTALDYLRHKQDQTFTVRDALYMALGARDAGHGLPVSDLSATGWIGDLLEQLQGNSNLKELTVSESFQGTLRPYQVRGYSWLAFFRQWGLGACLADDMGLGKTIQTLALIQRDYQATAARKRRPVLLVCPTSLTGNWFKEAARFTPDLPVLVHHGTDRNRGKAFAKEVRRHALVVSSYALLYRDYELFEPVKWAGLILDEAQNIKNPDTKQARAARALNAEYRIALTGTPVENHVGDLWSIMEFLNPGFLGGQTEFRKNFVLPIQVYRDKAVSERLKKLSGPFILRRLKTDKSIIADLPEKMEMKVYCTLTQEQASLYSATLENLEEELDSAEGIQRKGLVLALLSKLKQVCNHPAQFLKDQSPVPGRSGKLNRLTEMLEEALGVGDRALIFTQFAEMGFILQHYLQTTFARETLFLHGGTPKKQRDQFIERFQTDDGPPLFILSLKAGGTGLNLTRANHVFHFDRWWNPAVENQATDRAFRIGQTRNVQVHKFICTGTFEEKIDEMIERKKAVAEEVVGTGEAWLTELSTRDLKQLFALRQEALGD